MATSYIYKPVSDKESKGAVLLTPTASSAPTMKLPDGRIIKGVPADQRGGEFRTEHGYQWSFGLDPLQYEGIELSYAGQTTTINGGQSYEGSGLGQWQPRAKGSTSQYGGSNYGGSSLGGQTFYDSNGNALATVPNFADYSSLNFERVNPVPIKSNPIEFNQVEGVDNVDALALAREAGGQNTDALLENYAIARDVAGTNFEEARRRIIEANQANREEATTRLAGTPEANRILDNSLQNLEAFSQGRLSDPVLNEVMNNITRGQAAQRGNTVGGGVSSSFGLRASGLLNVTQRLQLQESAINSAPSFIQSALELRNGPQQAVQYNPNEIGTVARELAAGNIIDPSQVVQTELANRGNELRTQEFNAEGTFRADSFNSTQDFNVQSFNSTQDYNSQVYNSQTDLRVQLEKLQAQQFQYSTAASVENSTFNATRADNRFTELLGIQQQGLEAAQASGDTAAIAAAATGVIGLLTGSGLGGRIGRSIATALGIGTFWDSIVGKNDSTTGDVPADAPAPGSTGSGGAKSPNQGGSGGYWPTNTQQRLDRADQMIREVGNVQIGGGRVLQQTPEWNEIVDVYTRVMSDGKLTNAEIGRLTRIINNAQNRYKPGAAGLPDAEGNYRAPVTPVDNDDNGGTFGNPDPGGVSPTSPKPGWDEGMVNADPGEF